MMRRLRLWTVAVLIVAGCGFAAAQDWHKLINVALEETASYDFNDMAVGDMLTTIAADANVNIVQDTAEGGIDPARKLTVKFTDMSYRDILTWITRLSGADWVVQDEAVFVAPFDRFDTAAKLQLDRRRQSSRVVAQKTWLPVVRASLNQPRSIDLRNKRLPEAAASLRALLEVNIILSPALDRRIAVNLNVSQMSSENIIAWVARKASADYAVLDDAVYVAPERQIARIRTAGLDFSARGRAYDLVSFDFNNVPLDKALDELAHKAGVEIVLNATFATPPRVTLSGSDMSLMAALQAVTRATGFNSVIVSESGTVFVSVLEPVKPHDGPIEPAESPAPAETAPAAPAKQAPETEGEGQSGQTAQSPQTSGDASGKAGTGEI